MPKKKNRIIQVPMPESLIYSLDKLSHERGESRSSILREAAVRYVTGAREAEWVRQYVESYENHPEKEEELALGEAGGQLAAEVWGAEDWSEWYDEETGDDAAR